VWAQAADKRKVADDDDVLARTALADDVLGVEFYPGAFVAGQQRVDGREANPNALCSSRPPAPRTSGVP
jgi:hypothetical protein